MLHMVFVMLSSSKTLSPSGEKVTRAKKYNSKCRRKEPTLLTLWHPIIHKRVKGKNCLRPIHSDRGSLNSRRKADLFACYLVSYFCWISPIVSCWCSYVFAYDRRIQSTALFVLAKHYSFSVIPKFVVPLKRTGSEEKCKNNNK